MWVIFIRIRAYRDRHGELAEFDGREELLVWCY
jgi:hypothetical protein